MMYKGFNLTVAHASHKENPLEENTLGRFVCFSEKYALGHRHSFKTLEEAQKMVRVTKAISLPIFLKDNEENKPLLTTTAPVSTKLKEIGLIYVDAIKAREFTEKDRIGTDVKRTVEAQLAMEVSKYSTYLQSDSFSLSISLPNGKELDRMEDFDSPDLAYNVGKRLIDKYNGKETSILESA